GVCYAVIIFGLDECKCLFLMTSSSEPRVNILHCRLPCPFYLTSNTPIDPLRRCSIRVAFFFFQAEDGIRDFHVTGVQTCALPILRGLFPGSAYAARIAAGGEIRRDHEAWMQAGGYGVVLWVQADDYDTPFVLASRSEEHTSELQSRENLVCRLLLEKKKKKYKNEH